MNLLWIEDFGGGLDSGTATVTSMFGGLLSFENWDEDELSLLNNPIDLENFTKKYSSLHSISLCRHYFDYEELKSNIDIIKQFDAIIIDIRLDNGVDLSLDIPSKNQDKSKFHQNAGFYIFNNIAHLGFPVEKMCFMTGQDNSLTDFKQQCEKIYLPEANAFVKKGDDEFAKLRKWITKQNSDYTILRRGIIESCQSLKLSKELLRFDKYSSDDKKIAFLDADDYLNSLENSLPIREPSNKSAYYKLFVRTLAHEWGESVKPKSLEEDETTFAFSWIMKMTRNWISHNSNAIFNKLTEKDVAYFFICNMRAIYKLSSESQDYEKVLYLLFNDTEKSRKQIEENKIPLIANYVSYFNENNTNAIYFNYILNDLQNDKDKLKDKGDEFFLKGLYQCFWFLTSKCTNKNDKAK